MSTADQSEPWQCTLIIVEQLHGEADIAGQRAQVLHEDEDLADEEDAGLLGVCTGDAGLALPVLAKIHSSQMVFRQLFLVFKDNCLT